MLLCSFVTVARFLSVVAWLVRSTCVSVICFAIVFMFVAVIRFTAVVVARSYYSFVLVCVIVVWFVKFVRARVRDRAASYHSIVCVIVSGSYHSFVLVCVIVLLLIIRSCAWSCLARIIRSCSCAWSWSGSYHSFVLVCVIVSGSYQSFVCVIMVWFVIVRSRVRDRGSFVVRRRGWFPVFSRGALMFIRFRCVIVIVFAFPDRDLPRVPIFHRGLFVFAIPSCGFCVLRARDLVRVIVVISMPKCRFELLPSGERRFELCGLSPDWKLRTRSSVGVLVVVVIRSLQQIGPSVRGKGCFPGNSVHCSCPQRSR